MRKILVLLILIFNIHCAEAQVKVQDLTEDTTPARTDIGYTIKNPSSTPLPRKVKWSNILDLTGWSLSGTTITSTKNVTTTGTVTADAFVGDGSGLSGLSGSGASPAGSGSELQYRAGTQTLGAVTGSVVDGGNIGIGTTPAQELSVAGTIRASNDILIGSQSVCQEDGTNCPSAGSESDPVVKALTGIIKSNGSAISAVTAPSGTIVGTSDSQVLTNKTIVAGSNTVSGITESMQSISDVTTNNSSTSNHGYLKKLSGTSTEYMDGSGAWSTPAGSGAAGGGFTDGGTNVYTTTTTDNVGVGTTTPTSKLDVHGTAQVWTGSGTNNQATSSGELYVQGDLEVDGVSYIANLGSATTLNSQGICLADGTNCPAAAGNGWTDGGANVYTSATTDAVGLGTTTPSSTLEIVKQGSATEFMISSAATADGDYLIVKSSGNVGIGTVLPGTLLDVQGQGRFNSISFSGTAGQTNFSNANGLAFDSNAVTMTTPDFVIASSTNTGIGTSTPSTKLQVVGTITATAFAGDGSALTGVGAGFTDGGTNVYTTATTDTVGIGTTTPNASTLEIVKQSSVIPFKISSVATGSGDLMVISTAGALTVGSTLTTGGTNTQSTYSSGLVVNSGQKSTANGGDFIVKSSSSAAALQISADSGAVGIGTSSLNVNNAGLVVMYRNVGIGTINPGASLDIASGGIRAVGIGTTVPAGLCRTATGKIGTFAGTTFNGTCTAP